MPNKSAICLNECDGKCCSKYWGSFIDSAKVQEKAELDNVFRQKLIDYISQFFPKQQIVNLLKADAEYFQDAIGDIEYKKNKDKKTKRCLFYGDDKKCIIYDVRPGICRSYECEKMKL